MATMFGVGFDVGFTARTTTVVARAAGVSVAVVCFAIPVTTACVVSVMGLRTSVTGRACAGYVAAAALTVPVAAVVVVATVPDRDAAVSVGKAADSMVIVVTAVPDRSVVSVRA